MINYISLSFVLSSLSLSLVLKKYKSINIYIYICKYGNEVGVIYMTTRVPTIEYTNEAQIVHTV